jgi:ribosomal protein S12 methylthiotransferase accessory factor
VSKPVPALDDLTDTAPGGIADPLYRGLRAVSNQTGLIKRLYFEPLYPDDPAFYWAVSEPADLVPLLGHAVPNRGMAAAAVPERAAMKALGETLERYCAAFYDPDELVSGPSDALSGNAVDVRRFALFDTAQYATSLHPIDSPGEAAKDVVMSSKRFHFSPIDHDVSLRWTKARSLVTGEVVFVPAAFVYIPYIYDYPAEPIVADLVSTGLACGSTLAEACYKGLMEVIERDAFMLTWHHRIPAETIRLEAIGDLTTRDLLARFSRLPIRVEAFLISVGIEIPTVLVVLTGDQRPFHVVGAAADMSAHRALQLALEEAALSFCGLRRLCQQQSAWPSDAGFSDVDDLTTHAVVHAVSEELRGSLDFLRGGKKVDLGEYTSLRSSWREDLRISAGIVAKAGYDALAVDLTTVDVDDLGFKVVRAVIPGFQPLDINHNHRHLGGHRLQLMADRLGRTASSLHETLNTSPHPFP